MKIQDIIDFLFLLIGERFKGYHIKILAILNYLIGTITFFNEKIVAFLCDTFQYCISLDSKVMVALLTINSILIHAARKFVTTESAQLLKLPKRFQKGYQEEVQKLKLK